MEDNFSKSILDDHAELVSRSSQYWAGVGEKMSMELFHQVAKRVPAYRDFLKQNRVRPDTIRTYQDFTNLPIIDKQNYLKQYSLDELSWDGSMARSSNTIAASSGSTGEPTFWPISDDAEAAGRWYYELPHALQFKAHEHSTLVIVCYTLGAWMAGTFTYSCLLDLSRRGYPLSILAPGINKAEALKGIKNLSASFEQIVLIGYPPFIKDLIDEGEAVGIDWKSLNIKMMYGGEGFNETWREYVLEKIGSTNPYMDTASVYAASDAGIMGVETPTSILIKQLADGNQAISAQLYRSERCPSLQQFHPGLRNLESHAGNLVVTARGAIPLVRYNLKDEGGVLTFDEAEQRLGQQSNLGAVLKPFGAKLYRLPLVYVFGRAHNTATIYAVNVYPENIRSGLEDRRSRQLVSGKFKMATEYRSNMDQFLHISIELARDIAPSKSLEQAVSASIVDSLKRNNSEYNRLYEAVGSKVVPSLTFLTFGDPTFMPGAKLAKVTAKL